ncbi:MAG: GcrA family cell cycle regulator, partial [Pseudolabrys sp.]
PGWNDDRVAKLKSMWADGSSAGDIAVELGAVTRNAVIGKLGRLGLLGLTRASRPTRSRPKYPNRIGTARVLEFNPVARHRVARVEPPAPPPAPIDDAAIPLEQRRSLLELASNQCRWPVGDPRTAEFFFCGAAAADGRPYCPHHCGRAGSGYGRPLHKLAGAVR